MEKQKFWAIIEKNNGKVIENYSSAGDAWWYAIFSTKNEALSYVKRRNFSKPWIRNHKIIKLNLIK